MIYSVMIAAFVKHFPKYSELLVYYTGTIYLVMIAAFVKHLPKYLSYWYIIQEV